MLSFSYASCPKRMSSESTFLTLLFGLFVCSPLSQATTYIYQSDIAVVLPAANESGFLDHRRLNILLKALQSNESMRMEQRQSTSCDHFPAVYLSLPLRDLAPKYSLPVVKLENEQAPAIAMGHSIEGEVNVLVAIMKQNGWKSLAYLSDQSHDDKAIIEKLEKDNGFPVTSNLDDPSFEVVFVMCATSFCYHRFVDWFLVKAKKFNYKALSWVLGENTFLKAFQDLILQKNMRDIQVFGIKRSVSKEPNFKEIVEFYQDVDGLDMNEKAMVDSLYFYETMLALKQFLNCNCPFSKVLKDFNIQLSASGSGRIHQSYEVHQLSGSSTELVY